jgi:hypothetical protein
MGGGMTAGLWMASRPVTLTPHPLQRVGAFALAGLAGVRHPGEIGETELEHAVSVMHDDLCLTTDVADSNAPNGFWLGASYMFWPNSRVPNTTNRKKLTVQKRRELLRQWRRLPTPAEVIEAPCALCGRGACGFYGKVDVALGASVNYRNTTPRGHDGLALCRGCLASFHALPYGCAIAKGRAAVLHSWDEEFLGRWVSRQVHRTQQGADVAAGQFGDSRPYARQVAALARIREYDMRLTAGVDLMVFSNSNKEQALDAYAMSQPLAEWVRVTRHYPEMAAGWRYLVRAHHGPTVPGRSALARNLFAQPRRVVAAAAAYLRGEAGDLRVPPAEAPDLGLVCCDYAMKVLEMQKSDADEIRQLAKNVAGEAGQDESGFMQFIVASRKTSELKRWLRGKAISQVRFSRAPEAFISERQWRLLFDSPDDGFLNRDLLLICALEEVHALDPKWRTDDPAARGELDDGPGDIDDEEGDK